MLHRVRPLCARLTAATAMAMAIGAAALGMAGCGSGRPRPANAATNPAQTPATTTTAKTLPGTGRPTVTIGDKNFTEQFVLGELYLQALQAQGFNVLLNRNIGPTEVTIQGLQSGRISMYPEYIDKWNTAVAGYKHGFASAHSAYRAGQHWALSHGFKLLDPTPFGDTDAIAVTFNYAVHNSLASIGDLLKVATSLTLGAPLQFQQTADGLPALQRAYNVIPGGFKSLAIGDQYGALDQGTVQAADVNTTDGQLITGNYALLSDPKHVFGWGNVVPVVPQSVLRAEGPAFRATINRVSALLTTPVMRQLNAAVDVSGEDPKVVAQQFLAAHGLIPPTTS